MAITEQEAEELVTSIEADLENGPVTCDVIRDAVTLIHESEFTTQSQKDRICAISEEQHCDAPECTSGGGP
jgi:Arc/MetJ-type ribon-helix-helix transcriptional regulator